MLQSTPTRHEALQVISASEADQQACKAQKMESQQGTDRFKATFEVSKMTAHATMHRI